CRNRLPAISSEIAAPASRSEKIDHALASAAQYLLSQQTADGAWRSDTYATMKDGTALTPLAMEALLALPRSSTIDEACNRGALYLASLAKRDGTIDYGTGPNYPIYSASLAVGVLSKPAFALHRKARDAWLLDLRRRQLTEPLGWEPKDPPFGGWGYC